MVDICWIAIDKLTPNERNARTHSRKQIRQIADSITGFSLRRQKFISAVVTFVTDWLREFGQGKRAGTRSFLGVPRHRGTTQLEPRFCIGGVLFITGNRGCLCVSRGVVLVMI